ncbi:MAG: cytochrome-c oxidase [Gammaproteobacteria bacterium]|jgi:cytochrome c oxidase subunit 3
MSIFRQLTEKSWATQGVVGEINDRSRGLGPAAKTMLGFFLAVLTSMFFLFVIGYRMRMAMPDWEPIADPGLLWFNTGLLVLSSLFMQRAKLAAQESKISVVRNNLSVAGVLAAGFLIGQYLAWGYLHDAGLYAVNSPAAAFFFLLTALHALHLLGGMFVWAYSTFRSWQKIEVVRIKLSVELCTTYWHYLMLVWIVFFILLLAT